MNSPTTTAAGGSAADRSSFALRPTNVIPDTFGDAPSLDVCRFPESPVILMHTYRTDKDRLEQLLPDGLVPAHGDPIVNFRFRISQGLQWAENTHTVLGVTVPVDCETSEGELVTGMHWLVGWEDDPTAVSIAREVTGIAKFVAQLEHFPNLEGTSRCLLHSHGQPLIEMTYELGDELDEAEFAALAERARESNVIGYKRTPSADDSSVELSYATSYPLLTTVETARHVTGGVRFFETSVETVNWHHRAVNAVRSLPLLEPLGSLLTTAYMELLIGQGRRLT